jgi:hypothetical protein
VVSWTSLPSAPGATTFPRSPRISSARRADPARRAPELSDGAMQVLMKHDFPAACAARKHRPPRRGPRVGPGDRRRRSGGILEAAAAPASGSSPRTCSSCRSARHAGPWKDVIERALRQAGGNKARRPAFSASAASSSTR